MVQSTTALAVTDRIGAQAAYIQQLQKLGLSQSQAAIYLLLVANGQLRIQEIAELARLPRSSVYQALKGLNKLGLTEEVVAESFKKIIPNPISALTHALDEQMAELTQRTAGLKQLEQAIAAAPPTAQPSTVLHYYRGRAGARQLYWNSLKATNMVYAYSDWARRGYIGMQFYARFVAESRRRNIQEHVLSNPTAQALDSIRRLNVPQTPYARTPVEAIRYVPERGVVVLGDTLIYNNIYAQVYLDGSEINGFEIESPHFTRTQRSIFETLWHTATPVARLL